MVKNGKIRWLSLTASVVVFTAVLLGGCLNSSSLLPTSDPHETPSAGTASILLIHSIRQST
jgi:hypothetical protein